MAKAALCRVRMHAARLPRTPCFPAKRFILLFSPQVEQEGGGGGERTASGLRGGLRLQRIACMSIPPPPVMTRAGE